MTAPDRIAIAGVSGSGKSTLARRLESHGWPYTEVDSLYHGPEWTPRPDFLADVARLVAGHRWVTELQYRDARPLIAARADLLVWLDLPTALVLFRIVRRTIHRSRTHELLWNGNTEPGLWHALTAEEGIIRWAWRTRSKYRAMVPALASTHSHLRVVRLRSRAEVAGWLSEIQESASPGAARRGHERGDS